MKIRESKIASDFSVTSVYKSRPICQEYNSRYRHFVTSLLPRIPVNLGFSQKVVCNQIAELFFQFFMELWGTSSICCDPCNLSTLSVQTHPNYPFKSYHHEYLKRGNNDSKFFQSIFWHSQFQTGQVRFHICTFLPVLDGDFLKAGNYLWLIENRF